MIIDWTKPNAKELINKALDDYVNHKLREEVEIEHVVSDEFIEAYNVEDPTDFNGWQCDWWSSMEYKDEIIDVFGEAFYGKITLQLDK